ncbi:MAG: cysteine peptidase family C39 domain-containing protein [Bryobacteraceae bacterium]
MQTSNMDCGPAALKCVLEGFGIATSYERLREACQTGIDGSSIDTVEAVANQLGLQAEQVMIPADHILLEAAKHPAIVVVRLPGGFTHFVVLWRKHGNTVQVMDPVTGRRWVSKAHFASELYSHTLNVPAADWREFAGSPDFQTGLEKRLKNIGVSAEDNVRLRATACNDPQWSRLAALDAAIRLVTSLVESKAIRAGSAAARLVERFCQSPQLIPPAFWSVRGNDLQDELAMTGAVLVRILGRKAPVDEPQLIQELSAAISERPVRPVHALLQLLGAGGRWSAVFIAFTVVTISLALVAEALLFRTLFDVSNELRLAGQRMGAMAAIIGFSSVLLALEFWVFKGVARIARVLENKLRVAFLVKLPKLGDRYFQSRLISDMAERSHLTHRIRHIPDLCRQLLHSCCELLATAGAMIWLEPFSAPIVVATVAAGLIPAYAAQSVLRERDLRVRNHAAGLTRFYLDAALGLQAIRAHAAESNVRREHEKLVGQWAHSFRRLQQLAVTGEGIQLTLLFGLVAMLFLLQPISGTNIGRVLLVAYWALNLPTLGQDIGTVARQFPYYRNLTLRLLDPLRAPEEHSPRTGSNTCCTGERALKIDFRSVGATASGYTILEDLTFSIAAGRHVAIVGSSGAGKSSIAGLLLGWLRASSGGIYVDDQPLDVDALRRSIAWIDPGVQIWNDSLYSNLAYGSETDASNIGAAVDAAMLRSVLQTLREGMQTKLGESGGLLSGGEGQRVRIGRAMLKERPRLVILDEPFRGLDRDKRREFLHRSRALWHDCTLICITHDLAETRDFDQILAVEAGRVVEDGTPADLLADPQSYYWRSIEAERVANAEIWGGDFWRRIRIHSGRIVQELPRPSGEALRRTEVA